jgi:S-adenosylmethionine-dependent methyltransferase
VAGDRRGGGAPGAQDGRQFQPGPVQPGPVQPGPVQVGPVQVGPVQPGAGRRWKDDDPRTAVVRDELRAVISGLVAETGRPRLDIVDAGGGTGGFAVPLAGLGHAVTVIDPSPDSLAAAQRRAAEIAVPIRAIQGDVADLPAVVGEQSADLILCHSVLEYVDSPAAAMAGIARVLRPGGAVSVLAASAVAAVVHRALAGRFDEARRLLGGIAAESPGGIAAVSPGGIAAGPDGIGGGRPGEIAAGPDGSVAAAGLPDAVEAAGGERGAVGPRRFTLAGVVGLIEAAGLRPGAAHGVRVFADLVPGIFADADPAAADALLALERAASAHPAFHDIATQFHVLGYR